MNHINPKHLLHSKWTHKQVNNKEKHFIITEVEFDENSEVQWCVIQAVINQVNYQIDWHVLKDDTLWQFGWK